MSSLENRIRITQTLKEILAEILGDRLSPSEIGNDVPIFGEGLGLDSIDALELVPAIERKLGIKLRNLEYSNLYSVNKIAGLLICHQK